MDERTAISAWSEGDTLRLNMAGAWTVAEAKRLDHAMSSAAHAEANIRTVEFDFSGIERFDTAGAWLIHRTARDFAQQGLQVAYSGIGPARRILLEEVERNDRPILPPRRRPPPLERLVADTGSAVLISARDIVDGVALIGAILTVFLGYLIRPWRIRFTSIVYHLEHMALRAVPIIALISLLIGGIIEQQGVYQLRAFGAEVLSIDLAGILILREIGVLLTAIMVAGRTGSAITAELGSMKMREEIDAMRTLSLDPVEVLVVPRLIALVIALPLLTFVSDVTALFGAGLVAYFYIDITPTAFVDYLRIAVAMNTFLVGIIKAPFMALVIGMIACMEGLKVKGSAESLGRQTTASVVKAIFMVIVLDGVFAVFFAAINY